MILPASGVIISPDAGEARARNGSLEACLDRLASMHRQLCPRQVLGVRMGLLAADLLDLELPRVDKRLLAIVETDGCFADGVSVATGCWLGRRTLRLVDYGKVAVTFIDTFADRAVRVWPNALARPTAERYAPAASSRWQAQLLGYQKMPVEQLLCAEQVELADPIASLVGQPGCRELCANCGEEVINQREILTPHGRLCRACATGRYYRALPPAASGRVTSLRLSEVADLQHTDLPTVSRQVQASERVGIVERRPDPSDGRAILVHLTPRLEARTP